LRLREDVLVAEVYGEQGWSPESYFRLDDPYTEIIRSLSSDSTVGRLLKKTAALRLTRQDPWENLLMFICSTNNNAKRISYMVRKLCAAFGPTVDTPYGPVHLFPSARTLSRASIQELHACGLGYRADYILGSARLITERKMDLASLRTKPYEVARSVITEFPGCGNKVADCVCLFALEKLDSFPIDKWIRRVVVNSYQHLFPQPVTKRLMIGSLTPKLYDQVSATMRSYFGRYAGYAQNQLYYNARALLRRRAARKVGRKPL
jgi:N-glycosylase/DNA lyase